jgi:hypothetical protein
MINWLHDASILMQAVFLSGASVVLMWLGIIFIKPLLGLLLKHQADTNGVVGNSISAFSMFYGLLLGLISVAIYRNFSNLSGSITREASIVAALYRNFSAYDPPVREELQKALRAYVRTTIDEDWPTQMQVKVPTGGSDRVTLMYSKLTAYEPQRIGQQILHAEALRQFNTFVEVRRTRLANIVGSIPGVLWYVVLMGAALNIPLFWMFDLRFLVHMTLGGIVAFFLGVMILIIVNLERPFRGDVTVGAVPFAAVYDSMMRAPSDGHGMEMRAAGDG